MDVSPQLADFANKRCFSTLACAFFLSGCCESQSTTTPNKFQSKPIEQQQVWIVDDAERIGRHAGEIEVMSGHGNAIWQPGGPIQLFGLPGETIAFQVVASAGKEPLEGVTVEVSDFHGPGNINNPKGRATFRPIERFVVHELMMNRRSGGKNPHESLGWRAKSRPPDPSFGESIPDPLIPVEKAPSWADYPMTVRPGEHRVVWIDVTLPDEGLAPGQYVSTVEVGASGQKRLATLAIHLKVGPIALPYAALSTMVYFEPETLTTRIGSAAAIKHYLQLMHRHHLATVCSLRTEQEVEAMRLPLTGDLFTAEHGYDGPGQGVGASVVVLGAYGGYGEPEEAKLSIIRKASTALARLGIRDKPGEVDIFLYAADEQCDSPIGPGWRELLDKSGDETLRKLRVGHTCSEPPQEQGVDLVMMIASAYDPDLVKSAKAKNKRVWIYNGQLPHAGAFLTDSWHASLRANGWIQQKYD
ncbi:MAG: hypothetical protein CSA75_03710, partial [Sorangium cellulosum]